MATKMYGTLGSLKPAATNTWYMVFGVASDALRAVVSTAVVVNGDAADQTFKAAVTTGGSPGTADLYVANDELVYAKKRFPMTEGWTIAPGSELWFQATDTDVTIIAFGYIES